MASEVCRASDRGPARDPSDPEMAEGGSVGRRGVEGDEGRDAPGGSDDSPNAKGNFEFERRLRFRRKSGAD
jgi:hypothetical protein